MDSQYKAVKIVGTSVEIIEGTEKVCVDKFTSSKVLKLDNDSWTKDYESYLRSLLQFSTDLQSLFNDAELTFESIPKSYVNAGLQEGISK